MQHDLVCQWLDLPSGDWPPDHYVLLGLRPGEDNVGLIEQNVYERMEIVRRYQLTHPELATEAMNRLAQALVCLTDPHAKKLYDSKLAVPGAEAPLEEVLQAAEPIKDDQTKDDVGPGGDSDSAANVERILLSSMTDSAAHESLPKTIDELRGSRFTSRRELYFRIARTRQLIWLWEQVGKYLNPPTRYLTRPSEATDLIAHMKALRRLLRLFPLMLGRAGQPGYLVLALARQQLIVPTLQTLLPSQREALSRDWQAGYAFLNGQRDHWRDEMRQRRKRNVWKRGLRMAWSAVSDHPGVLLFVLALLALNMAFHEMRTTSVWITQVLAILVLIGLKFVIWWTSSRITDIDLPPRTDRNQRRRERVTAGEKGRQ